MNPHPPTLHNPEKALPDFTPQESAVESVEQCIFGVVRQSSKGLLQNICLKHLSTGGKRLRPLMIMKIAKALNLNSDKVLGWAAACEILHNATLIHDDLQDGDLLRRGQPTIWSEYGLAQAINAGDFLLTVAPRAIDQCQVDAAIKWKLNQIYVAMSADIVQGQSLELELNRNLQSPQLRAAYLECIRLKTSALFSRSIEGLSAIANLSAADQKELVFVFSELGILFQVQDDILDLFGNKGRDEVGCDIKEGKISSLVVEHLSQQPEDLAWLQIILDKDRSKTSPSDIERVTVAFEKSGTLANLISNIHLRSENILNTNLSQTQLEIHNIIKPLLAKIMEPISHLNTYRSQERSLM